MRWRRLGAGMILAAALLTTGCIFCGPCRPCCRRCCYPPPEAPARPGNGLTTPAR
jgi:hypothetical protein